MTNQVRDELRSAALYAARVCVAGFASWENKRREEFVLEAWRVILREIEPVVEKACETSDP